MIRRPDQPPSTSDSLWTADFRALFTASAISQLGTNIGYVALPLLAVSALHASAGQVGLLAALGTAAFLLIGLPAGAWVDRMRQRRVLIAADLVRAALFASIPVAWGLDRLTLGQLYVVALLNGCATVFFDVGSQTVLPQLVGRDGLVRANAAMVSLQAAGSIGGRGAGGGLVQLLTAPLAVICSAAGYLASAISLTRVRPSQPVPTRGERTTGLRTEIAQGLRHVLGNQELRALAFSAALLNFGSVIVNTLLPVLFVRELELPEGVLGLYWAAGGLGILLGARTARAIAGRFGYGRTLGLVGLCLAPGALLVPLIDRGGWLYVAGAGWLMVTFKMGVDNVLGVSLRQQLTPNALLGRMNATFRFLLTGAIAVGSAVAGALGEFAGLDTALWVGGVLMSVAFLPVLLSPVRTRRELPQPDVPSGPRPAPATKPA
ncbi:MFS transporter [Streptomyces sp. NPDC058268]|uniref:MFS transporter n=1 Tax=Streptomyces sp. NPDC058268 TaxID=3346413 RepID=UPI0036E87187